MSILESYVFRRLICDVPTNSLNKTFMILGRELKKHDSFASDYVGIIKYILLNKKSSQRFPTTEEFKNSLGTRDIYNFKNKNKIYLLERIENHNNKEKVNIEELLNNNELSIEHIMPQTITPTWKKMLGENWEHIHEKWLHALGNITLTGYNSKLKNKPFIEKRDMEKGFKESRLLLNKSLHEIDVWDESAIINRANQLTETAVKVWQYPTTIYTPKKEEGKLFTLADDDYNFTGKKIESFSFYEQEYKVSNWIKLYQKIVDILFDFDAVRFRSLLKNNRLGNNYITEEEGKLRIPIQVADKLYLEANLNTETILNLTRIIVQEFEFNLEDVSFSIK